MAASSWREVWTGKTTLQDASAVVGRSRYDDTAWTLLAEDARKGLALEPLDSLLDIGCGTGRLGSMLKPLVSRYVGLDFVPEMLRGLDRVAVADCTALPIASGMFSKALLSGVVGSLTSWQIGNAFVELRRVVRHGGRAFVSGCYDADKSHDYDGPTTWLTPHDWNCIATTAGWGHARAVHCNPALFEAAVTFNLVLTS